jgi:hypothetical protein
MNMKVLVAMGFDPAYSKKKQAAFTAVSVKGACPYCGRRYLIDWYQIRQSPEMHPELIGSFTRDFPDIQQVRIEVNAAQKALAVDPRLEELAKEHQFEVIEWNTDERKWDPVLGIPQAGRHVKSGMYSIPYRTIADQEYAEPVLKQLIRWPKKPNDWMMADWFAELSLMEMVENFRYLGSELIDEEDPFRTEHHDDMTSEFDLSADYWQQDDFGYQ